VLIRKFKQFVEEGHKTYLPGISIDCAVFGFHGNQLKVLLLKWKKLNGWSLPGGYIAKNEDGDDAARRLLKERTGLDHIYLQQYHTFTRVDRSKLPRLSLRNFEKMFGVKITKDNWLNTRVISIGYYAMVEYSKVTDPQADDFTEVCAWQDIHDLPHLLFDHQEMIDTALRALRQKIAYQPVGLNLLPEEFTMTELQKLYETILDHPLDRGNFRKKILALGILKKTGERPTGKAHKTPHLFSFDKKAYAKAMKEGVGFA
jgi:ADP-ribose pyrophosphatase YjhB (NUDIX family)